MPISQTLRKLRLDFRQCDRLIANAHKTDEAGVFHLSELDRRQVVVASFLNLFIAWETFIESCLAEFMAGAPTLSGTIPTRFVCPRDAESARKILIGVNRYFDYANHENLKRVCRLYFDSGYPFEPALSGATSDLADLKSMRNASAHVTSTTQAAFEAVMQRVMLVPRPGLELSDFLMSPHPGSLSGKTVFAEYRDRLLTLAEIVCKG